MGRLYKTTGRVGHERMLEMGFTPAEDFGPGHYTAHGAHSCTRCVEAGTPCVTAALFGTTYDNCYTRQACEHCKEVRYRCDRMVRIDIAYSWVGGRLTLLDREGEPDQSFGPAGQDEDESMAAADTDDEPAAQDADAAPAVALLASDTAGNMNNTDASSGSSSSTPDSGPGVIQSNADISAGKVPRSAASSRPSTRSSKTRRRSTLGKRRRASRTPEADDRARAYSSSPDIPLSHIRAYNDAAANLPPSPQDIAYAALLRRVEALEAEKIVQPQAENNHMSAVQLRSLTQNTTQLQLNFERLDAQVAHISQRQQNQPSAALVSSLEERVKDLTSRCKTIDALKVHCNKTAKAIDAMKACNVNFANAVQAAQWRHEKGIHAVDGNVHTTFKVATETAAKVDKLEKENAALRQQLAEQDRRMREATHLIAHCMTSSHLALKPQNNPADVFAKVVGYIKTILPDGLPAGLEQAVEKISEASQPALPSTMQPAATVSSSQQAAQLPGAGATITPQLPSPVPSITVQSPLQQLQQLQQVSAPSVSQLPQSSNPQPQLKNLQQTLSPRTQVPRQIQQAQPPSQLQNVRLQQAQQGPDHRSPPPYSQLTAAHTAQLHRRIQGAQQLQSTLHSQSAQPSQSAQRPQSAQHAPQSVPYPPQEAVQHSRPQHGHTQPPDQVAPTPTAGQNAQPMDTQPSNARLLATTQTLAM